MGPEETTGPETPAAPPSAPEDSSGESNFKYGQTAQSSNGWTVSLDSADAAEQITLSNGWTVEVKHE